MEGLIPALQGLQLVGKAGHKERNTHKKFANYTTGVSAPQQDGVIKPDLGSSHYIHLWRFHALGLLRSLEVNCALEQKTEDVQNGLADRTCDRRQRFLH